MLFAVLAVAASAASIAFAQDVTFNDASLTQCATSTLGFSGNSGPYYVAVVPASDACNGAVLADFHNVESTSIDYLCTAAEGTQVQVYVADNNGNEYWSGILTVGAGDSSCLGGSPASSTDASSTGTTSSSTPTSSSSSAARVATSASAYVVPVNAANSSPAAASTSLSGDQSPANAAANGASSATVSFALVGGAVLAAAALF